MPNEHEVALPSNLDAERTLLGAVLLNPELIHEAQQVVQAGDLYLDSHRRIYARMCELSESDRPIDIVTLADVLNGKKEINAVGGVAYISSLMDGVPHMPTVAEYARIVRDKSRARRLATCSQRAATRVIDGDDTADILADLEGDLMGLAETDKVKTLPEIGFSFLKNLHTLRTIDRDTLGLSYGIAGLDKATTGIREADYTIIAGRSGQGKSALARKIAFTAAMDDCPACVFTPEVTSEQFFSMLVPLVCNVRFSQVRDPRWLSKEELLMVQDATEKLIQLPIQIDDTSGIAISELIGKANIAIAKGAKIIIVDYLQLVQAPGKDERERTNRVSGALRNLAKTTKVPVIALSQLSRPGAKDGSERPTMFHLKESGSLEQDAYNVLLLFRPVLNGEFTGDDEILIPKQRFGDTGMVPVNFNKRMVTYEERAPM